MEQINKQEISRFKKNKFYKEFKAVAIISAVIGSILLFIHALENEKFEKLFYYILIGYTILFLLLTILSLKIKNRYFHKISQIILFPLGIIYAILTVIIPFWTLLIHLMFYFMLAFLVPELSYRALNYFHIIDFLKEPTILYLRITLTVFISVFLNPLLRDVIYLISPARIKTSQKLKPYELDKLTDYLLSNENVRFLVYGGYAIALFVTNLYSFQGLSLNQSSDLDKALLQSFITFIAFERAFSFMKQLDFRPSDLLAKIKNSIKNKINDENK